jgi:CrcB protein
VRNLTAIVIGGGVGTTVRYELALHLAPPTPPDFPWATFLINLTGSFLLGFVATMLLRAWANTLYVRPLVAVGLLGGFTTWSHFITESDQLIGAHQTGMAVLYMAASLGLGLLAVAAGAVLATVVAPARKKAEAG